LQGQNFAPRKTLIWGRYETLFGSIWSFTQRPAT
jgi:hypothetical protein